jgi:hypothetical protein
MGGAQFARGKPLQFFFPCEKPKKNVNTKKTSFRISAKIKTFPPQLRHTNPFASIQIVSGRAAKLKPTTMSNQS